MCDYNKKTNRRTFVLSGWAVIKVGAVLAFFYPVVQFVKFYIPPKPRFVRVEKRLLIGDVHLDPDFILFVGEKSAWAVSRKCTHLGCRLNFNQEQKLLVCPCHNSQFTPEGLRVAGPAKDDLARYVVEPLAENKGFMVTL
jgi:cytochrome b6-f complex iron-sulfur subunit